MIINPLILTKIITEQGPNKLNQLLTKTISVLSEEDLAGVSAIGSGILQDCTELTIVHIPSHVNSIDNAAFSGCINLQEIIIDKEQDAIEGAPWGAPDTATVRWKDEVESV